MDNILYSIINYRNNIRFTNAPKCLKNIIYFSKYIIATKKFSIKKINDIFEYKNINALCIMCSNGIHTKDFYIKTIDVNLLIINYLNYKIRLELIDKDSIDLKIFGDDYNFITDITPVWKDEGEISISHLNDLLLKNLNKIVFKYFMRF